MAIKDMIATDMAAVFGNSSEFGEQITYYPDGDIRSPKLIQAVVVRGPVVSMQTSEADTLVLQATIRIADDATDGIATINKGVDKALVKLQKDDSSATTVRIIEIVEQQPGYWVLGVIK